MATSSGFMASRQADYLNFALGASVTGVLAGHVGAMQRKLFISS
jgi:hypothetical protein